MATEKAQPGDTILVKHNSWNSSWLIGFEFPVIKQASYAKPGEVTIRTKKGDYFVRHGDYKIVRRAKGVAVYEEGTVIFEVGDIVTWHCVTTERCRIVDKPDGKEDAPPNNVWLQGLGKSRSEKPLYGETKYLTLLEKGSQTTKKGGCCPDCKGTGRIQMLNWDVDCNCVKKE